MKESVIEKYLVKRVKGIGGLCYKFVSPGNSGMPDRLVVYNGKIIPVETKRPGGKPRDLQQWVHEQFGSCGVIVYTLDTKFAVDVFVKLIYKDYAMGA